ncbi:hypothetical protein WJX74_003977 [Apatococcus lobatus]|uniref:anthranilate synthase n=1 Tax=Apatococcus lobatus TaxID=904363 RepID=A0AAW1RA40_9CHLO
MYLKSPALESVPRESSQEDAEWQAFQLAAGSFNLVPVYKRLFSDQLTAVLAYRCLVKEDDRAAPSFLFESVVNGNQTGRFSFVGAQPALEVVAKGQTVTVLDHVHGKRSVQQQADPMQVAIQLSEAWKPAALDGLPADVFAGGWVGYTSYDTVRYVYPGKLPFRNAPEDDRGLPDIHLALYNDVVVFDQATKLAYVISWAHLDGQTGPREAFQAAKQRRSRLCKRLSAANAPRLPNGQVSLALDMQPKTPDAANVTRQEFLDNVALVKEHIQAGDIFQLVLSQRFERRTFADPFEIYRALRVVNPSPYMVYLQARGSILVASSPEILCRLGEDRTVTNRPLAGTRRRGKTPEDDEALEKELLADAKECSEHVMLVDLGRNDVGKVSEFGSVDVEALMQIERYSHVMHISSTVTGRLKAGLDAWDALRAALPAGTVSGAPKVKAMEIIDKLETTRRGPYGGGIGHVGFNGSMDIALALRTMVIPTAGTDSLYSYDGAAPRRDWTVHLQAGAGLVADSTPELEYEECVNKAAALGRAVDLAESAFSPGPSSSQMLDLPLDSQGLAFLAASNPHDLLLIPGLLPASITAAALGDQQAASYLRFAAQQFAAFQSPRSDDIEDICAAATREADHDDFSPYHEMQSLLQKGQERQSILSKRKEYSAELLCETTRRGMLAELKWLRGLCQHNADAESQLMGIAAGNGHLDVLQHLRSGPNPAPWGNSCNRAVEHTDCLKWLLESGCPCQDRTLRGLAGRGHLDTLQWIRAHPRAVVPSSSWNTTVIAAAVESSSLPLLQWLHEPPVSCPWDSSCTTAAAWNSDLPTLQWLRAQDPPCPLTSHAARAAAACGNLPMLQWLRAQGCPWDAMCCYGAADNGSIAMLHWARAQHVPCPWNEMSTQAAAGKPSLECLQWLRAQDPPCPWNTGACVAAASADFGVLKWLRAQDPPCPWDAATAEQAAMYGNLPMLQWLHEQGCAIDGRAYLAAAFLWQEQGPHKPILQWLHGLGVPAPAEPPAAAHIDDVPVLLWWADNGFLLLPEHHKIVNRARRRYCTFHGLLRWFRRAVSNPTCGAHLAFDSFAPSNAGQDLLVRLCQLPPELITRIAVAADMQQDII